MGILDFWNAATGAPIRTEPAPPAHTPMGPAGGRAVVLRNGYGDEVRLRVGEVFDPADWRGDVWRVVAIE